MVSRVVVLVSGGGTNLQALLDAGQSAYAIVGVAADRPDALGLERARQRGIPTAVVEPEDFADRRAWDAGLAAAVAAWSPDWVVCAGFMRILGTTFLESFPLRVVNTHPALLPSFPGAHGVRDALAYGVRVTGCTVHLVDAGVDTGPVLAQRAVEILADDDEVSLHERIKAEERELLVEVITRLCAYGCTVDGRKASIP
ncbi:MAG: phosphoribosylglycinamide formyltransferase [Candidatus Nanopelagicales bacterium]